MKTGEATCPACGGGDLDIFHEESAVPVHSCVLLDTAAQAREVPRGRIRLALCSGCGFVANTAFDPARVDYSSGYEDAQGCSPLFREYADELAKRWVERYDLAGRTVMEIGCGKGEFLTGMVACGVGQGVGIDPAVVPERTTSSQPDRLTWISDTFSEKYFGIEPAAIVCRHTLEHIPRVADFLGCVRAFVEGRPSTVLLFELPDAFRVFRETAFWDVYYEHCSYFTVDSLTGLFRRCGFDVISAGLEYDGQYIVIEARPAPTGQIAAGQVSVGSREAIERAAHAFEAAYNDTIGAWRVRLARLSEAGRRVVIWGGSSKGVAFLNAVGNAGNIDFVVDINPYKQNKYVPGSAHRVVEPEHLREHQPDVVIVMNPVYCAEISQSLANMGVRAELWSV